MNITNVGASRIGAHAHRYLFTKSRQGTVLSLFQHGFNVLFDEDSDVGFVPFQSVSVPLHPWAIELPDLAGIPAVGAPSTVEGDCIRFDDELSIAMGDAEICELRIQPWRQDEAVSAQRRVLKIKDSYAAKLTESYPGSISRQSREDLIRETGKTLEAILHELVGSGRGSTPSGDDFLVGSLAVLWATRTFSLHADRQIKGFRVLCRWEKLVERTPLPSAQMILAATEGSFAEPIQVFLATIIGEEDELIADATATLVAQGATSGIDVLSGILAALRSIDH
ncbi:DUF2877 domain-containing protein [Candidatus Bipolaricaulota bacterium]